MPGPAHLPPGLEAARDRAASAPRDLPNSLVTVFILFTMDHWYSLLQDTWKIPEINKVISSLYIILWLLIGSFIFRNIFVAIMGKCPGPGRLTHTTARSLPPRLLPNGDRIASSIPEALQAAGELRGPGRAGQTLLGASCCHSSASTGPSLPRPKGRRQVCTPLAPPLSRVSLGLAVTNFKNIRSDLIEEVKQIETQKRADLFKMQIREK